MEVQSLDRKPLQMSWQDWLNVSLGVWLILAPIFGIGQLQDAAAWNSYLMGTVVVVAGGAALVRARPWEEWTNLLVGLWLIVAPFSLHFLAQRDATWNQIVAGVAISITAGSALFSLRNAYRST